MDDLDDDPLPSFAKSPHLADTIQQFSHTISVNEHRDCAHTKVALQSDIAKLKHRITSLESEKDDVVRDLREDKERSLDSAFKQYEKNVQYIRNRHQENIKALQEKHEIELETTIKKYEDQITIMRHQIADLPTLRVSLQSKDEEIAALQEELKSNKKNYDERVNKLIRDLEDEKVEEQAEKWDLKKYVEIFKKRCLVLESMLENLQRANTDLKDKIRETVKNCEIKISKAKIDYETRQRFMEDEVQLLRKSMDEDRLQASKDVHRATQKLEEERTTYESRILILSGDLAEYKKIRQTLEEKNKELEKNLGVFRDAVSKIKDQYEVTLKEVRIENELKNKNHKKELDKLSQKIEKYGIPRNEGKDKEIQTTLENNSNFTKELEGIQAKFAKEKLEYESTIARLTSQMCEQKECFSKIIQLKQQLEVTSVNLESSSESNRKYFKEFIKLKKDFEQAKKYYEVQLRKHHQEIQKYQNMNKEISIKYDKLRKEYDLQMKNSSTLQKRRQELETANEEMRSKFSQTTKAIDSHMETLKATIDDNKTFYMETVLQLKQQIEDLMGQNRCMEEASEKRLENALALQHCAFQKDYQILENERDALAQKLQIEMDNLGDLHQQLDEQKSTINEIKNGHLIDVQKIREHYEKEMKHTDDLILILTNDLEHNNKKYNKLKAIKARTTSKTKSQLSTYEQKIKSLEKQLEEANKLLESTNTNLQQEITHLLESKSHLEESKTHVESENNRYQQKIHDLETLCENLQQELLKDRSLLQDKTDYETTICDLKASIETNKKEYEEYIKRLKEDIKRGKTYIEQLIEIKSNLEAKLKNYEKKIITLQKYVRETFMKYNAQLAQELSLEEVTTFERKVPTTNEEL